jgi:hypothetical protein
MVQPKRAICAAIGVVALLVGGCGPTILREFRGISAAGTMFYPGEEVGCAGTGECADLLAEVDAWADAHERGRGAVVWVTLHEPASEDGTAGIMRSGGSTWMAVVTFADGSRTALMVGCGVGIDPEMCFSVDADGRDHNTR